MLEGCLEDIACPENELVLTIKPDSSRQQIVGDRILKAPGGFAAAGIGHELHDGIALRRFLHEEGWSPRGVIGTVAVFVVGDTNSAGDNNVESIFEIETGSFNVAMYVSYALSIMENGMVCYLTYLIKGNTDSPWLYTSAIMIGLFGLSPVNFRYSRVFLLYWLSPKVHYHPELDIPAATTGKP